MKTTALFQNRTVLSYEVFPPKATTPVATIYDTLEDLRELNPDFISVTYGAGGGKNNNETFRIASAIQDYGMNAVVHLPCIGLRKGDVVEKLEQLKLLGVENILALRGDLPKDSIALQGDFSHANELIAFIKEHSDFNILAACYPEGHIESESLTKDIENLKRKVDAGAEHLISQLFFNNDYFYDFQERCLANNIDVPIEAGIMPVTNKKQIERMVSLCGATVPQKFVTMMEKYEGNKEAMRDAGIAYAVDQIVDLIAHGVQGIHLYTMNQPYIARQIHKAIHSLL